jgi:hypothetical protein
MNCPADIKDEKEGSMKRTSKLDDAICRGNHIWILGNAYRGRILLFKDMRWGRVRGGFSPISRPT